MVAIFTPHRRNFTASQIMNEIFVKGADIDPRHHHPVEKGP